MYREKEHPYTRELLFESCGSRLEEGPLHSLRVGTPYTSKDHLQHKCYIAQSMGTTYIYNFLELFRQVGVVAWHLTLRTPQYPKGREVVLDITYQIGSFLDPRGPAIQVGRALKSHDIPY